jgi:hypothetical protein
MTNPRVVAIQARRRFIYQGAGVLAAVLMIALAAGQLALNGKRGLMSGEFIALDLAMGFGVFRVGSWLSLGFYQLRRAMRARKSGMRRRP